MEPYDEGDWNTVSTRHGPAIDQYRLSKVSAHTRNLLPPAVCPPILSFEHTARLAPPISQVLAERAAWELAGSTGVELATVCPAFIVGPPRTRRRDGESVEFMLKVSRCGCSTLPQHVAAC